MQVMVDAGVCCGLGNIAEEAAINTKNDHVVDTGMMGPSLGQII
jgi:hypothetical protein